MRFERWWFTVPLRLKSVFWRNRVEREMEEELEFHIDQKTQEGLALGLSAEEARRRAIRAMEGLEQRKEEMRAARRVHWLTDFIDDVRFAFRSLGRAPGLSALVVVTLALGIGMTATPFSMLDALIFRPYPVPDPSSIVTLTGTSPENPYESLSYREYLDVRDRTSSFDGVIANTAASAAAFAANAGEAPRVRGAMLVSGNYFRVLGVEPSIGRGFRADEDRVPGRDAVAVLGADFWKNDLGGDASVVGRKVRLNGVEFTVVGVAPESFPGMQLFVRPDIYVPLAMAPAFSTNPQKRFFEDRDDRELTVRARLKRGVTLRAARAEIVTLARAFAAENPSLYRDRSAALYTQFEIRTRGDDVNWKFSVVFVILAVATLLTACTNVAGLLLSRSRARTREIAIRLAMGASRFRLIRLLLTETLVLAGLGGLAGIWIADAGIGFFQAFVIPAELPVKIPFELDLRVLAACFAMSVASALFCGLAPAWQSTRPDLLTGLKASEVDERGRRLWGRNVLVVTQVAMSLMLLTAALLMTRSFRDSVVQGIGFPRENLLLARFDPRLARYDAASSERFYRMLTERAGQIPGVRSAGLSRNPPLGLGDFGAASFVPEDFEMPADRANFTVTADTVDEGFFRTTGIPIVRGRDFLAADDAHSPKVAIVNERLAEKYWPNRDAVGRRVRLNDRGGAVVEIVGVARTVKYRGTSEKPTEFLYLPLAQHPFERMVLLLRTEGNPKQVADPLQKTVHALDPNLPVSELRTFEDVYNYQAVEGPGIAIRLVFVLGGIGLALAIGGLYGLAAYNVSRRTREIGIRIAIGARPSSVMRMMMVRSLNLVAIGAAIGLILGFGVERLMNAMLFNAGRVDVLAYVIVLPVILAVTLLAAWVPARRASRIPPTLALRCD